jgi:hypothetical protein
MISGWLALWITIDDFDFETRVLEWFDNLFGGRLSAMFPVHCVTYVCGPDPLFLVDAPGLEPGTPCM